MRKNNSGQWQPNEPAVGSKFRDRLKRHAAKTVATGSEDQTEPKKEVPQSKSR